MHTVSWLIGYLVSSMWLGQWTHGHLKTKTCKDTKYFRTDENLAQSLLNRRIKFQDHRKIKLDSSHINAAGRSKSWILILLTAVMITHYYYYHYYNIIIIIMSIRPRSRTMSLQESSNTESLQHNRLMVIHITWMQIRLCFCFRFATVLKKIMRYL